MPIRTQALLLFSLIVMLLTVVFASRAAMIASQAVREKIVQQTANNTASFLSTQNYPINDNLMSKLSTMFDVQFMAVEKREKPASQTPPGKVLGTSLEDPTAREEVAKVLEDLPANGQMLIGGTRFFYHQSEPVHTDWDPSHKNTILYVLIPETQLSQAATAAFWGVVRFGLIVLVVGSILTWFFAERFTRPIRLLARAMDDPAQLPTQPAGTSDEIRQLYRSFATLLERQKQSQQVLVDSERLVAIGRMAAAVAHELRNPLSGIKMNLQVLQDGLEQSDPSLDLALQEVDRMELYLKEIMHLVVPVSETVPRRTVTNRHQKTTCQPAEAIRAALLLFAGRLRHAGIEVDIELPDEPIPAVRLGESEYRQVLANLLINAMEATPEGGRLQVSAAIDGDRVKTSVADSGSGVILKDQENPFRIFTSTKVDGTGLGLYICKRIVDEAGGQIGYENHTDTPGATFWFELPIS